MKSVLLQILPYSHRYQGGYVSRCVRLLLLFSRSLGSCCIFQLELEESNEAVAAAQRLSDQLDRKEEMVSALREEGR